MTARRLRQLGLDALEHSGDGLALMELWNIDDEVILVDAMQSGANAGTVLTWDPITHPLCAESYRCSTHAFGPREAIELARALDRLPARIQIYGIEAASFEPGEPPCREVLEAVERVAGEIALTRV